MLYEHIDENRVAEYQTIDPAYALLPNKQYKILWHLDERPVLRNGKFEPSLPNEISKYKIILAFEQAFNYWAPMLAPIRFEPSGKYLGSQIIIKFRQNGDSDLKRVFNKSTLAFAYYPNKLSMGINSDIFVNDARPWAEMAKPPYFNLMKVMVHEIGHALGIKHNNIKGSIMYPTLANNDTVTISQDTKNAIRYLYDGIRDRIIKEIYENENKPPEEPEEPNIPDEPKPEDPKPEEPPKEDPKPEEPTPEIPCPEYAIPQADMDELAKILAANEQYDELLRSHLVKWSMVNGRLQKNNKALKSFYKQLLEKTGNKPL